MGTDLMWRVHVGRRVEDAATKEAEAKRHPLAPGNVSIRDLPYCTVTFTGSVFPSSAQNHWCIYL